MKKKKAETSLQQLKLTLSQAKQAMLQTSLQPLHTTLEFSLLGPADESAAAAAAAAAALASAPWEEEEDLVSLSSHLSGLFCAEGA